MYNNKWILIDNGIGFSDIKGKVKDIINPYYTTKKNGTGLGLSIVQNIITEHEGQFIIKSEYGRGSNFTIYLPVDSNLSIS